MTLHRKTNRLEHQGIKIEFIGQIELYYDRRVLDAEPEAPRLIADESDYSVWFKPFGVLSQGSRWGDHCAMTRCAEKALSPERPALVVHRLDRAATGLMLLAHRKRAAALLGVSRDTFFRKLKEYNL